MKNKLKQFCVGVKDINIKNHTYYLFNDVVNVKDFDPHNIKIDEKSYKKLYLRYWTCGNQKRPKNL